MSVRSKDSKSSKDSKNKTKGSTVNGTGTNKSSGVNLMQAVVNKDIHSAEIAIKNGADVNSMDDHGWTPLRKAARAGFLDMVSFLIENGADVTQRDQVVVLTAASWGRPDVLRQLLSAKADVGPNSEWEITPFIAAAENGHTRIMKVLLEFGADINQEDKSGNDPLMAAWDANRAEIVLFLVERGANLKKASDWVRLAASPVTAAQIAEGIHRRNIRRIQEDEQAGIATVDTYNPGIKIPLDALCRWIEMVPKAAVTFLDKVLLKQPKDAPIRAHMSGEYMRTFYLNINEWNPKEVPQLLRLAPKDSSGPGSVVSTMVLHQFGSLNKDLLFCMSRSDPSMFKSFALQGLLHHVWNNFTRQRFIIDCTLEGLAIISLICWAFINDHGQPNEYLMMICLVMIIILLVTDILDEIRQLNFYSSVGAMKDYYNDWTSSTGASISRYFRIVLSITSVCSALASNMHTEHNYSHSDCPAGEKNKYSCPSFYQEIEDRSNNTPIIVFEIFFSLLVFCRWFTLINYLLCSEHLGPSIIPIVSALKSVGPFLLVNCTFLLAFFHIAILMQFDYYSNKDSAMDDYYNIFITQFKLIFLRTFEYEEYMTYQNTTFYYMAMFIFLIASCLTSIVLLNIFIAVIIEAIDFEQEKSMQTFMQQRNHTCLKYYLSMEGTITAPIDAFLRLVFKSFRGPDSDAYLWMTCLTDESQVGKLKTHLTESETLSRLGWIKSTLRVCFKNAFSRVDDVLLDSENQLKKRWSLVTREMKTMIHESKDGVQKLINHYEDLEKKSKEEDESSSELDAVEEVSANASDKS